MNCKSNNQKTVAFCTSSMTFRLSRDIFLGIQEACKNENINIICFDGELLYPEDSETNQSGGNIIYDFVSPSTIDGIIMYTADIGEYVNDGQLKMLCDSFAPIPLVTILREVQGYPAITSDNYSGMYALVEHLIQEHNYKNIAFVKGPANNFEANERFRAYREVIQKHKINDSDSLVCDGEFSRISGHEAVDTLLTKRKVSVDVIISVDDETAIGVSESLHNRGIVVPDDIAITGFDNEEMSAVMNSPLTTVAQSLVRDGELALKSLKKIWNGDTTCTNVKVPTELVVRNSCGCNGNSFEKISENQVGSRNIDSVTSLGTEFSLSSVKSEMISHLKEISLERNLSINDKNCEQLVSSLVEAHETGKDRNYFRILWEILMDISNRGEFISPIQEVFNHFYSIGMRTLTIDSVLIFEKLLHRSRIMVGNVAERVHSFLRIDAVERFINLGDVNYTLNAHFTHNTIREQLCDIADGNFKRLGIKSFFLAFYSNSDTPLQKSKLLFAWDRGVQIECDDSSEYSTKELLPPCHAKILRERNTAISPLFFNDDQFGYIIAETSPRDAMIIDILAWQISGALNRIELISREEKRRVELEQSLDNLKKMQKQLVQSEKMAALGNLVAGVSHEINTPIGAGITYASHFQEITSNMNKNFAEGKITKSGLQEYLELCTEISNGIMINLNRAAELVRSFKEIAVDQTTEDKRTFNLKEYIDEVLLSLKKMIEQNECSIHFECPEELVITSYPGHISQIILNLIMNSLTHAFTDGRVGKIEISVSSDSDLFTILYEDNGVGVTEDIKKQMFDPFFTTKREEGGSGLGLNIVYNIITQSLNGTIDCSNRDDGGIQFTMNIPLL